MKVFFDGDLDVKLEAVTEFLDVPAELKNWLAEPGIFDSKISEINSLKLDRNLLPGFEELIQPAQTMLDFALGKYKQNNINNDRNGSAVAHILARFLTEANRMIKETKNIQRQLNGLEDSEYKMRAIFDAVEQISKLDRKKILRGYIEPSLRGDTPNRSKISVSSDDNTDIIREIFSKVKKSKWIKDVEVKESGDGDSFKLYLTI